MADETLVMTIDARPAEDGGRRYARTIDEVTKANEKADSATDKLEERFRSLAKTTADSTKSAAGWVLHHSILLGTVGLLSRGLSVITTGAMAMFLGMTGRVSEALANATSYAALFAAKGLRSLSGLLDSAGGRLAGFSGGLATGATWLERWGALTLKLSIGMVALGAAAAVVAAKITSAAAAAGNDFIPAWNRVLTLAKGTPAELRKLRSELESLASELGVNQAEAASQYYEVLSALPEAIENPTAGLKVLEAALKASATGFTTTEDAISAITGVLYNYNLAADQAGAVADALFKAQDLGSLTFGEVAASISTAAPLVSALGGSYQDLLAITALVTRGQTTTSEAMTQVSAAMSALLTQTGPAAQASKELGIEFSAASVQAKGLAGFLLDIIDKTNGHPEVLAKFFGRKEAITLLVSLAQRTDELRSVVAETADSAGGAERIYKQMNETLGRQVDLLQGPYKRALLDLGILMDRTAIGALKLANHVQSFIGGIDFRKMFAVSDAPLFADSAVFGQPNFAGGATPRLSAVKVMGRARPAPEAATVEHSTEKIQALQDSLRAAAIAAVDASDDFGAYDRSLTAADKSVNALVISEMARLKAAGVEQSEVNKLASLYKDVWEEARRRAEEHRKAIEDLTAAMATYQAQVVAGFTVTDALEEKAIARREAEDRRRQQFTNLGGTLSLVTPPAREKSPQEIEREFKAASLRQFNDTIDAVKNVSSAFGELANVLGDMSPLIEGALRGFESFANGLARFKAGQSQGGTLGMLAQVSGAIGMAAGALQVARGLFDDSERDALLKQNNEALDRLRQSLENPATFGDTLTTLSTIDAIQARPGFKNNQRPSEITRFSEDERKAIKEAADRFGIDVFDKNGKIVRTALQQLEDALRDSALSVSEFGKTVAGQKTLRDAFNEIFDITDPGQLLQSEFDQLAQRSGGLFGDLKNLDLTSGTGRDVLETRIRDLITKAMGGDLTATDLSGFSSVQEFIDSLLSIDHGLDAFSEGLNKATSAVTDIPKAINLALYERRFGSGLGPSPRDARDTSPSIPGTPEFRANSGSGPTNTFYITIEGSEKPVGALFDEIEAESQRRVRGGGTVVLGRTSL